MAAAQEGLRFVESGDGDAVLLLDWTPWETSALADSLSAEYRVISVYPPDSAVGVGTPRQAAEAVAGIAARLGLNTFSVVGTSLGANTAFHLALLRAGAVGPLALVSPTCICPSGPRSWNTPELAVSTMLAHPEGNSGALPDGQRTAALASLAERWRASGGDSSDLLPELGWATLVVLGQEDRLVSRDAGGVWKDRVPNCSVSYVYDAGHAVGVDRPDALANVVLDFLERREAFIVEKRSSLLSP